jgi:hypothetical protein
LTTPTVLDRHITEDGYVDETIRRIYRATRRGKSTMKKGKVTSTLSGVLLLLGVIATQAGAQSFDLHVVADPNTSIPGRSENFTGFYIPVISGSNVAFLGGGSTEGGIYLFNGTTLIKVVDSNTLIPGGSGNFEGLDIPLAISGNNVAFWGAGVAEAGIYLFNGITLDKIADTNTPIPDGSGNFAGFAWWVLSGGNAAFYATGSSGQNGIYFFNGTTLSKVADPNTPIPDGSGNFIEVLYPVISGGNVAFLGIGPSDQRGIYLFNGTSLIKVADLNTPVPGGSGNFVDLWSPPVISGSNVAFLGMGDGLGIYLFDGTKLSKVADYTTPVPGGSGNFVDFFSPVISGNNVAFSGGDPLARYGVYFFNGTVLSKVADHDTAIPSGSGNFDNIGKPVISGNNVAFPAGGPPYQAGIYFFNGTTLSKVVDRNTPLPGARNFYAFKGMDISGSNIAFLAWDSSVSGQEGIYLASLQSPQAVSVPILTDLGMVIVSVLLGGSGIYFLRRRKAV